MRKGSVFLVLFMALFMMMPVGLFADSIVSKVDYFSVQLSKFDAWVLKERTYMVLWLENGSHASITFYPEGEKLPANSYIEASTGIFYYKVFFHQNYYERIVDLLRNEDGVKFHYNHDNNFGQIRDSYCPVGTETAATKSE